MPHRIALTALALPVLLAACDGDTDIADTQAENVTAMDTTIDTTAPVDNSVPAATIPEETMPPVLPAPDETQELGNNGIVPGEDNGAGNVR